MFRYRLHSPGGDDLGEAIHAQMIKPGEEIPRRRSAVPRPRRDPVRALGERTRRVVCLSPAYDSSCVEEPHCGRFKHGKTK